eukprot:g8444.t1
MNAGEVVLAKRLLMMAVLNVMSGGEEEATFVPLVAWCCLTRERKIERPRFPILRRTIDSVGESESYTNFRFRRDQLRVVMDALGFPDELQAGNGLRFGGEEVFLFMLRRMSTHLRLTELEREFGRDSTALSRMFRMATDLVFEKHSGRLKNGLGLFAEHFAMFAAKIHAKGASEAGGDDINVVDQNVALFIDGTIFEICRVRGRNNTQEAFWDGHHRRHALGMQGVIAPNGLLVDVWGMYPGRRHDEHMVFDSGVNTRMRDCQAGNVLQYKIMGDKAYSVRSHIGSPFVGNNISPQQRAFNLNLSRLRVSVEHGFGKVGQYFDVAPPTIHEYLGV